MLLNEILKQVGVVKNCLPSIFAFCRKSLWNGILVGFSYIAVVLAVGLGGLFYALDSFNAQSSLFLKDLQKDRTYKELLILKDTLRLCSESIKNDHHYKERYCDKSLSLFELSIATKRDDFYEELITAKAYEQMSIYNDASIRYIDTKALLDKEEYALKRRIFDLFLTPLGINIYSFFIFCILFFPFILFYMDSKRLKEEATILNKQFGNSLDGS